MVVFWANFNYWPVYFYHTHPHNQPIKSHSSVFSTTWLKYNWHNGICHNIPVGSFCRNSICWNNNPISTVIKITQLSLSYRLIGRNLQTRLVFPSRLALLLGQTNTFRSFIFLSLFSVSFALSRDLSYI